MDVYFQVLYKKYEGNPSLLLSKVQDTEAQCEFMRQREHLERTVASLKRQVLKGSLSQRGEHDKMMEVMPQVLITKQASFT